MRCRENKNVTERYFREHCNERNRVAVDRLFANDFSEGSSATREGPTRRLDILQDTSAILDQIRSQNPARR